MRPSPPPFDERGEIDRGRFRTALARWVASPLTGFVVLGSNGEAPLLDEDESDRVIAAARDTIPRGRPIIAGTGRESTRAAIRGSRRAAALGADAVIVRTPGFFKSQMTSDVFVRHYTAVADASPVPVLLYNFTAVTGVNLGRRRRGAPRRASERRRHQGIGRRRGADRRVLVAGRRPESFRVFAGSSTSFYASLCVGASGGILALAASCPTRACGSSS